MNKWLDIPTLYNMSNDDYRSLVRNIVFLDHHEILRANINNDSPPIATTKEQFEILIEELSILGSGMRSKSRE